MIEEFATLSRSLKRYLRRYIKRQEDVDELVQESFLKLLEQGAEGEIEYPKAYLRRTAHNLAVNLIKKKSNQLEVFMEDIADPNVLEVLAVGQSAERVAAGQVRFELFCRVAAQLPEQCRKAFILCKVYGFSQREVAETMGISVSTVEKHIAKALLLSARMIAEAESEKQVSAPEISSKKHDEYC